MTSCKRRCSLTLDGWSTCTDTARGTTWWSLVFLSPAALAHHVQGLFFQTGPDSELTLVRSAHRLGRWKQGQTKLRAILVELLSVAAKHTAFRSSSRLRGMKIMLDEDLTPQQMKQRRGLSPDFQLLKARGYKPFFRGPTLKYRDGALIRKCAQGEANKVVAAAGQALGQQCLHRLGISRLKGLVALQWPWTLLSCCVSMEFLASILILTV